MNFIRTQLLEKYFTSEFLLQLLHVFLIVLIGVLIVRLIDILIRRSLMRGASEQSRVMVHKTIVYLGWAIIFLAVLSELGVKLSAVLGAAGVLGIAVGIASQKSLGNIISGFFLVSDKTFDLGDVIKVGSTLGVVHSLDLLSVKLRTFDNTLIRIPNDQIITTEIINITRFPIRRLDFQLKVAYREDLPGVKEALLNLARGNPLCLDEPEPFFLYQEFGPSGVEILFAVWFEKSDYVEVKNSVFESIKAKFDEMGIEIPYQQIRLYNGSSSKPFEVLVKD
ncbi:MAG: mechanosensitive ion channel family protein [Sediminispirochaetaceae bacterium]